MIICIFFIFILNIYIVLPYTVTLILRSRFKSIIKRNECIFLTFDDGPNPDSTPQIVHLLEEFNVKATFFLRGENAEKYPDIVKSIVDMGHEIGHHSFWHTHAWKSGPCQTLSDLVRGKNAIEKYCLSQKTLFFRPPYGKLNLFSLLYILFKRWQLIFWTLDPKDYECESGEKAARFVIDNLSNGSVVLLHDGRRQKNSDPQVTVTTVRLILEYFKKRNVRCATIGTLFDCTVH